MQLEPIHNYADFTAAVRRAGFSMGGGNSEGILTLSDYFAPEIRWHTGEPETDPWAWRMRAVTEERDIAYGKFFFGKGGYITKKWLPCFLAVRRDGAELQELYEDGAVTSMEKDIYDLVCTEGRASLHQLKAMLHCGKEDVSRFESAITRLQGRLFLTVCGETRKLSKTGEAYGWPVTVFCRAEDAFGEAVWEEAGALSSEDAERKIRQRILELNPEAKEKAIKKFIYG